MLPRRTVLKSLALPVLVRPLAALESRRQAPRIEFSASELATMTAVAEVVLPTALGADGRDLVVQQFATWVRDYREGADMGHGYGASTLRRPSGPSPAQKYPQQFAALDAAARAAGASTFAALPAAARRTLVEQVLNEPRVARLPSQPTGANLVADFMGLYYSSPEAWDLAYERRIGRDRCRSLKGSEGKPGAM